MTELIFQGPYHDLIYEQMVEQPYISPLFNKNESVWIALESPIITRFFIHDDVIKWEHFPHYWPFVWGIHRSLVNSPHKGQLRGALMFSLICAWINGYKQSWGWWFETPSCLLWRHCNGKPYFLNDCHRRVVPLICNVRLSVNFWCSGYIFHGK